MQGLTQAFCPRFCWTWTALAHEGRFHRRIQMPDVVTSQWASWGTGKMQD